jgi:hypothetical protein
MAKTRRQSLSLDEPIIRRKKKKTWLYVNFCYNK